MEVSVHKQPAAFPRSTRPLSRCQSFPLISRPSSATVFEQRLAQLVPAATHEVQRVVTNPAGGRNGWLKTYGGSGSDYINEVLATNDNGFLLVWATDSDRSGPLVPQQERTRYLD